MDDRTSPSDADEFAEVQEQFDADPELGKHLARSYATVEGNRVHQALDVLRNLLTALEPIRERKMLLYFSAGVPVKSQSLRSRKSSSWRWICRSSSNGTYI